MKINKYTFDNGKYEVHSADDGSSLVAYRHGEFWQNMIGDNLTAAMLYRIEEIEDMLSRLVKENDLAMPNENYQWMYSPMRVECLKLLENK